jgi:hypothetical protein
MDIPHDILKLIMFHRFAAMCEKKLNSIQNTELSNVKLLWCEANQVIMQSIKWWTIYAPMLICCSCDKCTVLSIEPNK